MTKHKKTDKQLSLLKPEPAWTRWPGDLLYEAGSMMRCNEGHVVGTIKRDVYTNQLMCRSDVDWAPEFIQATPRYLNRCKICRASIPWHLSTRIGKRHPNARSRQWVTKPLDGPSSEPSSEPLA